MKIKLYTSFLIIIYSFGFAQKKESNTAFVQFKSDEFKNNKYYLAGNYGKYQTLLDSVIASKEGKVIFKKNEKYVEGIYMLVDKDKKITLEFLMDNKQQFIIQPDLKNPENTIIENSPTNISFTKFNLFIKSNLDKITELNNSLPNQKTKQDSLKVTNTIKTIQKEITNYKNTYNINNNDVLSLLFRLTKPVDDFSTLPIEMKLPTKKDSVDYLKVTYFKDIDLSDA